MQDWSMIPLHIRCTERYKIDPGYPNDDAKWWNMQEKMRGAQRDPGSMSPGQSERQLELLEFIRDHGEVDQKAITKRFGYTSQEVQHIINGITFRHPVCEDMRGRFCVYSVLPST